MNEQEIFKLLSQEELKDYYAVYKEDFSEINLYKTPDYFSKQDVEYMLNDLPKLKDKIVKQ